MCHWQLALAAKVLALALLCSPAGGAEAPAAPAPSPPPAAVAPAAPAGAPAQPAAAPAVPAKAVLIRAAPAPLPDVFGGTVEFAEKAFPVLAEHKDADLQTALAAARLQPCRTCRGTGLIKKQSTLFAQGMKMNDPLLLPWEQVCGGCGGFRTSFGATFGQRLVALVDCLAHMERSDQAVSNARSARGCLAAALEYRDTTYTTYKVLNSDKREILPAPGPGSLAKRTVSLQKVPDETVTYSFDASALIAPLWQTARLQPPAGQVVVVVGEIRESMTGSGGWTVLKVDCAVSARPQPQVTTVAADVPALGVRPGVPGSRAPARPTPPAGETAPLMVLRRTSSTGTLPAGRVVVGGLLVGKWTSPAGGGCPVVMAVLTALPGASGVPPSN